MDQYGLWRRDGFVAGTSERRGQGERATRRLSGGATGDSGLSENIREQLADITSPLHLQVFVTPTCPYCPGAVHLAHQMAFENKNIVADMVEATEFPHLTQKHGVRGEPGTVGNEQGIGDGAMPPEMLMEKLLAANVIS